MIMLGGCLGGALESNPTPLRLEVVEFVQNDAWNVTFRMRATNSGLQYVEVTRTDALIDAVESRGLPVRGAHIHNPGTNGTAFLQPGTRIAPGASEEIVLRGDFSRGTYRPDWNERSDKLAYTADVGLFYETSTHRYHVLVDVGCYFADGTTATYTGCGEERVLLNQAVAQEYPE